METTTPTAPPAWRRSWRLVLGSAALLPPLGAVLLWMRPWPRTLPRRVLGFTGRLALTGFLAILTVLYGIGLGIVHVSMRGSGWQPIFTLRSPQSDQEALERDRTKQRAQPLPASLALESQTHALPADSPSVTAATGAPTIAPESKTPAVPGDSPSVTAATGAPAIFSPARGYWTNFRGPRRDGVYAETPVLTAWPSAGLTPLWRQPVGGGYASFVIANGKAYTIEQRRGNETVAAYDLATGRETWTSSWPALFTESMGGDGPRATPTWDDGRLYALGAAGDFRCLDAETGKVLWSKNILTDNGAGNLSWGMSASPLVVDGKVIVQPGGSNGRSVVAYDKLTGARVWSTLDDPQAYTSPMEATLGGRRQILTVTARNVVGLAIEDGAALWSFPWPTSFDINSAQPIVVGANRVFVSAGYDHGAALIEVSVSDGHFSARAVWENRNLKSRFNSAVLYQDHIYGFDESIFACIDVRTGQRKWKAGRYGYGQVVLASGHLIVTSESGDLVLLRATPERHEEVASFSAVEGKTWNHPAISDGILLIRNTREMAAFRISP